MARQRLTITVSVLGTVYDRNLYDAALRARLTGTRDAVALLPEKSRLRVSAEKVYQDAIAALGPTAAIGQDIASGIEASWPIVESIAFTVPLGALGSVIDPVDTRVRHKGQARTVPVALDLADLPGTVARIARGFAEA